MKYVRRSARTVFALGVALLMAAALTRSGQAAPLVKEDLEAGIRLPLPAGWKTDSNEPCDWEFSWGNSSVLVTFDYSAPPVGEAPGSLRDYALRQSSEALAVMGAERIGGKPTTVAGVAAHLVSFRQGGPKPLVQGQIAYLPRAPGVVIFTFSTLIKSYPGDSLRFQELLERVQLPAPGGLDAATVPLRVRPLANVTEGVPLPDHWHSHRDQDGQSFVGRLGWCNVVVDSGLPFAPSDAQLVVRSALEQSKGVEAQVLDQRGLTVDGWPAYTGRYRMKSEDEGEVVVGILAIVRREQMIRVDFYGPAPHADYTAALMKRIIAEWRFGAQGPGGGATGELKWQRREQRRLGASFEAPEDWKAEAMPDGGMVLRSGMGVLIVGRESTVGPDAAPTPEAMVENFMKMVGKGAGGRAKVVAKGQRRVEGFPPGNLVVFTLSVPESGIAKGWIFLCPRNNDMLTICMLGPEPHYTALRPVLLQVLDSLRPLGKGEDDPGTTTSRRLRWDRACDTVG